MPDHPALRTGKEISFAGHRGPCAATGHALRGAACVRWPQEKRAERSGNGRGAIHVLSTPAAKRHPLPGMRASIPGNGLGCGQQVELALTASVP